MEPKTQENFLNEDLEDFIFITCTYKEGSKGIKPEYQFETTIFPLYNKIRKCMSFFEIYPELTINNTIHYHIICKIKDKIKYHKSVLPALKYEGFVKAEKVKNIQNVMKYCKKDVESMEKILKRELPVTHDDKFKPLYSDVIKKKNRTSLWEKNEAEYLDEMKKKTTNTIFNYIKFPNK